jgi:hypothetical protein
MNPLLLITGLPALAGKLLDFLKSPAGIALLLGLAYGVGYWRGDKLADAKCEARIQSSISEAKRIDEKAATEREAAMRVQKAEAETRMVRAEQEAKRYEQELKDKSNCVIGDGDERIISVPNSNLPSRAPAPPVHR